MSVIVPVYEKTTVLPEVLAALKAQKVPVGWFEVIVVDDGSPDPIPQAIVHEIDPIPARLIRQCNSGAGVARNRGACLATGELLLFIDGDMVASPGLVDGHWREHTRHDRLLVAGRIRPPSGLEGTAYGAFARAFDLGRSPGELSVGRGLTGNLSIKAERFKELGGFNAALVRGQDVEFSYRAQQSGYTIRYAPQAAACHKHVMSFSRLCRKTRDDHAHLVRLLSSWPAIAPELDYLADKWPIRWQEDAAGLIVRKGTRRLLAVGPVRRTMRAMCLVLERAQSDPALVNSLAWKTLASYQLIGLRDGIKRYGWRPRSE